MFFNFKLHNFFWRLLSAANLRLKRTFTSYCYFISLQKIVKFPIKIYVCVFKLQKGFLNKKNRTNICNTCLLKRNLNATQILTMTISIYTLLKEN